MLAGEDQRVSFHPRVPATPHMAVMPEPLHPGDGQMPVCQWLRGVKAASEMIKVASLVLRAEGVCSLGMISVCPSTRASLSQFGKSRQRLEGVYSLGVISEHPCQPTNGSEASSACAHLGSRDCQEWLYQQFRQAWAAAGGLVHWG